MIPTQCQILQLISKVFFFGEGGEGGGGGVLIRTMQHVRHVTQVIKKQIQ